MNDTQAQARPVRPTLEEVEAYVHGKGYDVPGAANAFYGNFFYAYHDARVWRRADGTPVADWRAEADTWHERGPHYLEPEPRAAAPAPAASAPVSAPAPEAPVASPEALSVGGALPPLEVADVATLAATDRAFHEAVVRKTGIPPRFARRIAEGEAAPEHAYDARLARGGGLYIYGPRGVGKTELACRIAYDYAGSRLDPRFGNWAYRPVPKGRPKHGVRFVVSADLMTELRSTFDKGGDSEADVIRRYVNVPVLIDRRPGQGLLDPVGAREAVPDRQRPLRGRARHDRDQPVHPGRPRRGAVGVRPQGGRPGDRLAPGRDDRARQGRRPGPPHGALRRRGGRAMSRRAPQEGRSYEQALYSVVLLVPRLPRPERTRTVRVLLDFIAGLWELDRSRVDADFASLVRGLPR